MEYHGGRAPRRRLFGFFNFEAIEGQSRLELWEARPFRQEVFGFPRRRWSDLAGGDVFVPDLIGWFFVAS